MSEVLMDWKHTETHYISEVVGLKIYTARSQELVTERHILDDFYAWAIDNRINFEEFEYLGNDSLMSHRQDPDDKDGILYYVEAVFVPQNV